MARVRFNVMPKPAATKSKIDIDKTLKVTRPLADEMRNASEGHIVTEQELRDVFEDAARVADKKEHVVEFLCPQRVIGFERPNMFVAKMERAEREERTFSANYNFNTGELSVAVGPQGSAAKPSVMEPTPKTEVPTEEDTYFAECLGRLAQFADKTDQKISVLCDPSTHEIIAEKKPIKR